MCFFVAPFEPMLVNKRMLLSTVLIYCLCGLCRFQQCSIFFRPSDACIFYEHTFGYVTIEFYWKFTTPSATTNYRQGN